MRGAAPKHRKALCHPNRRHYAKDMCQPCYDVNKAGRNQTISPRKDEQRGLVRGIPAGWGSI
jgi:hypothetical protein